MILTRLVKSNYDQGKLRSYLLNPTELQNLKDALNKLDTTKDFRLVVSLLSDDQKAKVKGPVDAYLTIVEEERKEKPKF